MSLGFHPVSGAPVSDVGINLVTGVGSAAGVANATGDLRADAIQDGSSTAAATASGALRADASQTGSASGAGTTQVIGYVDVINATAAAGFTNAARQQVGGTISTVNTTTPLFIGLYVSPSAANVVTPRHSCIEVVGQ